MRRGSERFPHATQDQARHNRRVQAADAVDDRLGFPDHAHDLRVRRRVDLLPVRVDVPDALDPRGQLLLVRLGEQDVRLPQQGQRAGEIGVLGLHVVCRSDALRRHPVRQRGRRAGVRDGVLARDDGPVREAGADVVAEVGVDGGDDGDVGADAANEREQVDGGVEGAGEEPRARQEEVAQRGGAEVEGRGRGARPLEDLQVQVVEHAADELALGWGDGCPQGGRPGHEGLPGGEREGGGGREAVVEEGVDGQVGRGDEADEAACGTWLAGSYAVVAHRGRDIAVERRVLRSKGRLDNIGIQA